MNKGGLFINGAIACILILAILYITFDIREGFISHGVYPQSVNKPLLQEYYPLKTPGGLSTWNYADQWKLFPIWSTGSYEQKTNNIKKWKQPCNGTAAPADICGGLYKEQSVDEECWPAPPSRNCRRVNYFCS
jgi:hypothetical protein